MNNDFFYLHKFCFIYIKLPATTNLARIKSTAPPTGADKYVRNVLDVTRVSVHRFAYAIIDNWYRNLL